MARIDRILRAVEAEPWAIQPEKLEQIAQILVSRAEQGTLPTAEEAREVEARQRSSVEARGAVAVIPLIGTISRRMGMLEAASGGASVETFTRSFREAMADDSVGSILLDIHSPGGSVYGIEEAARMIFDARGKKRVVAVADQLMASAAYYLGASAEELVVTPSGEVGSIGVYMVHFDWSAAFEDAGIRATIIRAGARKAEGNPYEPLPEEAVAHFQSLIDDYHDLFIQAVARGRGVSAATVRESFGQGRTYTATRAVERGMADRVATIEEVVEDLQKGRLTGGRRGGLLHREGRAAVTAETAADAVYPRLTALRETAAAACAEATDGGASLEECVERAVSLVAPILAAREGGETTTETDTETETAAAGGHAAGPDDDAPTPAPAAREESMSSKDTAAQTDGAATEDAILEERKRARQIRELCQAHGIDESKAERWIADGLEVERVRGLVLDELRTRQDEAPKVRVGADREAERPFGSLGEQLIAVARNPGDKRLAHLNEQFKKYAAATGASTTVPSDGGFVIQPDFARGITSKMWDEGQVLSRTNRVPIGEGANGLVRHHIKEHSRKTGSRYGGVRVYRVSEADTVEASKQQLRRQRIELEKLMGLFYATEEILQDAAALTAEAERGFRRELTFVSENEIFRGSGAGECLGFLNSAALVSVPKEGSQAADTVEVQNVAKMMSRLPPRSLPTAAWFIHRGVIPQLVGMTVGEQPVFLPGGNISGAPFGTLFGIPVVPVEYCAPLGDLGDILLVDLAEYTTIDKRGVTWQESIHVRFIYDETAFKLTYRFNGQPDWDEAVEEFQGTDKISPFIALAERA